jgi:hypothetical protein
LEKSDLVEPENLYVYEFELNDNGKSFVKEVQYTDSGFQFDLFTNSALNLYTEAKRIGEILTKDEGTSKKTEWANL